MSTAEKLPVSTEDYLAGEIWGGNGRSQRLSCQHCLKFGNNSQTKTQRLALPPFYVRHESQSGTGRRLFLPRRTGYLRQQGS